MLDGNFRTMARKMIPPKLHVGEIISVVGWVMLKKLPAASYRVAAISHQHGLDMYSFAKPKGQKIVARHYVKDVDPWVKPGSTDQNRIEVFRPVRSFFVWYWYAGTDGGYLLGGVKESQSSRWQSYADAIEWLANVKQTNATAGRLAEGKVVPSLLPPAIFTHCGTIPQVVGCRCAGCGKLLTKQDASEAKAIHGD